MKYEVRRFSSLFPRPLPSADIIIFLFINPRIENIFFRLVFYQNVILNLYKIGHYIITIETMGM